MTILMLTACGKQSDLNAVPASAKGTVGGCMQEYNTLCNEYYGMATKAWVKKNCDAMKSPLLDKCPTEKALTRCVFDGGTMQERHLLVYKENAKFYCKQAGVVEKAP